MLRLAKAISFFRVFSQGKRGDRGSLYSIWKTLLVRSFFSRLHSSLPADSSQRVTKPSSFINKPGFILFDLHRHCWRCVLHSRERLHPKGKHLPFSELLKSSGILNPGQPSSVSKHWQLNDMWLGKGKKPLLPSCYIEKVLTQTPENGQKSPWLHSQKTTELLKPCGRSVSL